MNHRFKDVLTSAKHYLKELSRPGYENEALTTQLQAAIDAEDQPRAIEVLGAVMDHLQEVAGNHMMPPAAMGGPLFYLSTIRGVGNRDATKTLVYYGTSFCIPAEAFAKAEHFKYDKGPEVVLKAFTDQYGDLLTPALGEPVERYEYRDMETDDVWVTYRAAYERAEPNA